VEKQVEEINKGLARYESIKRVTLLAKEFSVETGGAHPDPLARRGPHPPAADRPRRGGPPVLLGVPAAPHRDEDEA
jgi:hypothetical protein